MHTIELRVSPHQEVIEYINACEGETAIVFGEAVTQAGRYSRSYQSATGCDSLHNIEVSFQSFITTTEEVAICEGESTNVFGKEISAAGIFTNNFTASTGCDSMHTIAVIQNIPQRITCLLYTSPSPRDRG